MSDLGRVRSIRGTNGRSYFARILVLKTQVSRKGYPFVRLYRDGKPVGQFVHRMVARAFLGPRPDGMGVRHRDDNKLNNALTNLVYGTAIENQDDSIRNGTNACIAQDPLPSSATSTRPANTYWKKNGGGRGLPEVHEAAKP